VHTHTRVCLCCRFWFHLLALKSLNLYYLIFSNLNLSLFLCIRLCLCVAAAG
jgi:hypothetical protein